MGESACLMQPFSYASGIPNEAHEGNPIHALGQSVSFGRFMSESLSWEKWSTFSHNKYVEEAERFSRPGSVAQKKAFFEAHYKNLAARKAAALLEQANAASNNASESEAGGGVVHDTTPPDPQIKDEIPKEQIRAPAAERGFMEDAKRAGSVTEHPVLVTDSMKDVSFDKKFGYDNTEMRKLELREKPQMEICVKNESSGQNGVVENEMKAEYLDLGGMEKPLLQSPNSNKDEVKTTSKKKQPHSTLKSSTNGRESKVPYSPAKLTARIHPKKESNSTPATKKSAMDAADKKRSTPKSSQKSMNFTPAKEFNRLASTIIRRLDGSRVGSNSKAPSKDCSTPLRTPTTACVSGKPKQPADTPWSEKRSARTPLDPPASGSKTVRRKWGFLPTENKSQSTCIFTPFSLKTEERAARRKQKLEEKFNGSQTEEVLQQATLKEKAGTELRKLRQSFCFKARPLPDFYKERKSTKDQIKLLPVTQTETSPPEEQPTSSRGSTVQAKNSPPRKKSSFKNIGSKLMQGKKNQNPVRSLISRAATMVAHENTSPNIQLGSHAGWT
ncbi:hypothetical protein SLE2022_194310 [Rubroshorea leprosula]